MKKQVSILILTLTFFALAVSAQNDLFQKGIQQYDAKQYEQAAETFKQVTVQSPRDYAAFYNLGLCYYFLGRYEQAMTPFQQSISIKPDYTKAHYYLGNSHTELNRPNEALASYQKAIQSDPKFFQARYEAGNVLNSLKRFPEAIASFNEAIRLNPNYPEAYLGLGNSYYNDKNYLPSIPHYKKATELRPGYLTATLYLADAYLNSKQYDSAIETYKKAAAIDAKSADSYYGLGLTYYNLKNYPKVREQVAILKTLDPAKADSLEQRTGGSKTTAPTPAPIPVVVATPKSTPVPVPRTAQRIKDEQDVAKMQDFGFDGAVVTAVASIRETPKATGKVLLAVKRGDILSLSSREPSGTFYQVVEEKTGIEGWIDAKSVVVKLTGNTADSGPPLEESRAANATANPVVNISNLEEKTTLSIRINGTLYKIPPQTTKTLSVPAGKFTYYGWSPGIRPTRGSKSLEKGKQYEWKFKIFRR